MPQSFLKKALRDFHAYVPGEQPADGQGWVKLNTNESPLPPSPRVIEAIKDAANESLRLYPSPTAEPARRAIAASHEVDPAQVLLGNGGDELIEMCFRAFAGAGDRVAYPTPTYPLLEPLCRVHEAVPAPFASGLEGMWSQDFMQDAAPLKFVVNPNSPTGAWAGPVEVEKTVEASPGVVVVDEAYVDFAPMSCAGFIPRYQNMLVLRTLSKSYALAGLRVGYALGNPTLIASLEAVKDSYNLDRLAIAATVAAIEDETHHKKIVEHVVAEREWLGDRLREQGYEVAPSAANFLFVKPPAGKHGAAVADALRERRILVRRYDLDPIAGWLRITIGTRDQHDRLLAALKEI
ncbi:MAG TPA: histidinol-phosphate transaminase [Candidatus Dormibacteraeota bacterium]|nr:histidinol-phosphate transaminase [Candidatus Dormibacteraeota bacterium]